MEIDVIGSEREQEARRAASAALEAAGVADGHVAIVFVKADEMQTINRDHRKLDKPTDVLAFPVDGTGPTAGARELGDVIVCPEYANDVTEVVVHGVLHLCGYDHEVDEGEMFALQDEIVARLKESP